MQVEVGDNARQARRGGRPGATLSALALLLAFAAPPASAEVYAGGGPQATDCLAVFVAPVNYPVGRERQVRCTDGDPACDADATVNGICRVPVSLCANASSQGSCSPDVIDRIVVDHALDNGDPRFDVDFQALQARVDSTIDPPTQALDVCTTPVEIAVRIRGPNRSNRCRRGRKRLRVITSTELPNQRRDVDALPILCEPASCDPTLLFTGTFDRIQAQVFDASCALSGCHDSQGLRGGLTLERGSAYGALVGVDPQNPTALASGWQRVAPNDPETSLIHHKLRRPPDPALGARMPFGRTALPLYLRNLIDVWITAGAPDMGWVPGTD